MGACTSQQKKPQTTSAAPAPKVLDKLPIDTSEVYSFQVTIGRLKLRGVPRVSTTQNSYSMKLDWGSRSFSTSVQTCEDPKWPNEWSFVTNSPIATMQESYLTLSLLAGKNNTLTAQVFILLWDIVTGPSYQNFPLIDMKHQTIGRVGLDAKVQQQTQMEISPSSVSCEFLHEDAGHYSMSILCAEKEEKETGHSAVADEPKWIFAQDDFLPGEKLKLKLETTIESLRTASLQFRVWKHHKHDPPTLAGECWIDFNKLLKDERFAALRRELSKTIMVNKESSTNSTGYSVDTIMQQKDAKIERELQEKLWRSGKHVGTMELKITVKNFPFIAQVIAGVNTEDGVRLQSVSFMEGKKRSRTVLPQMLKDVVSILDKLKEFLTTKPSPLQVRKTVINSHIAETQELTKKLLETEKESMVSHVYNTEAELMDAQQIFMDLGEYLLKYADIVAYEVKGYYYECLSHLIHRGELDLGHVSLERALDPSLKAKKTEIGVRYRSFLRKLLIAAIAKMNLKGVDQKVQEFSETIFAVAYFRMPEFKDKILAALKRKSFDPIPEWRGTAYDLEVDITSHSEFLPMFNWEPFFYSFLPPEEDQKYVQALNEERWQNRMEKRGLAFFRFVAKWATLVKRVFVHKNVPYEDIPGYTVMLKAFLLEMKERRIEAYPEALMVASKVLLYNPTLVSIFMLITFHKTNMFRFETVMETYRLINQWLTVMYENGHSLPANFLHSVFISALTATLKDEVALNVVNSLWLILRNYHILHPDIKRSIVLDCILGSEAKRFMYHWSEIVRQFFWNFVLFRLKSLSICPIEPITKVDEEVLARAEALISSLSNSAEANGLTTDLLPYFELSRKEYSAKSNLYQEWLVTLQPILAEFKGQKRKYGPFDEYPFPDIQVERVFEDEVENKLEEEW